MPNIFSIASVFYNRQFQTHPILTICTTNAILAGISDTLTQTYLTTKPDSHSQANGKNKDKDRHNSTYSKQSKDFGLKSRSGSGPGSESTFDYPRLGRFMLYNFSVAPLMHTWFSALDRRFPIKASLPDTSHGSRSRVPRVMTAFAPGLRRMVVDQALFAPFGLALMFTSLTFMEGGGIAQVKDKLDQTFMTALKANYTVWPLVQLVNFR
ncbi:hypothetical protein BGZ94_007694 [Podila epigama]|nr:hypothetical protein BGZ94_007694 [Podila epigama]